MSDLQAEDAVRRSMERLAAQDVPLNSASVPDAGRELLLGEGASHSDAQERIQKAIDEMTKRGELMSSSNPWVGWSLTGQ